jgi:toxin ParE1/3/4
MILWAPEAEQDLLDIWDYLAATGEDIADRQLRDIDAACRSLDRSPFRGRARDELRQGLRSIFIDRYVAFYRVRGTAVEIVRVLHERRDIGAIFGDES